MAATCPRRDPACRRPPPCRPLLLGRCGHAREALDCGSADHVQIQSRRVWRLHERRRIGRTSSATEGGDAEAVRCVRAVSAGAKGARSTTSGARCAASRVRCASPRWRATSPSSSSSTTTSGTAAPQWSSSPRQSRGLSNRYVLITPAQNLLPSERSARRCVVEFSTDSAVWHPTGLMALHTDERRYI